MNKGCAHFIFGPIGAGKSTFAWQLAKQHKAIKLSTDEWFKTLYYDDISDIPALDWTFQRITRCERQLWSNAQQSIELGNDMIFDTPYNSAMNGNG